MVKSGLEVLLSSKRNTILKKRVGLVTQPAAVTRRLIDSVTALREAGFNLVCLFGPEHGILGAAADGMAVESGRDPRSGLPVFSLYGAIREPTRDMLAGVDLLIFDMQDVGARFYTYISTMVNVLRGAAKAGIPVVVLDRPNPLNGLVVEGPVLEAGFESFIGALPVPIRHGLTMGELALFANSRLEIHAALDVIPLSGWRRRMDFDQTGRVWVPTSPALAHLAAVRLYPGTCLVEGCNLSEGRGTAMPFEVVGAPWLDGSRAAEQLNRAGLPGVLFRSIAFTPSASKHAGLTCSGIQVHITEKEAFRSVLTGLKILEICRELSAGQFCLLPSSQEGKADHFDLLTGSGAVRQQFLAGVPAEETAAAWQPTLSQFLLARQPFLLYD